MSQKPTHRFAARLREVEGRLDRGCGSRWLAASTKCDGLPAVARLLLRVQRRCTSLPQQDDSWLQELCVLSPPALEEQQAELSRRLAQRIDELERAVPRARTPSEVIGEVVFKQFEGHGTFLGTVVEYDEHTGFRVQARAYPRAPPPRARAAS